MRRFTLLAWASLAFANSKRGLVFVPSADHPEDNSIWTRDGSAISWYYNYESTPSPAFSDVSQDDFRFVPMMWGVDTNNLEADDFLRDVESLIDDDGRNITHVLGFNEPDAAWDVGGSNILPEDAAKAWVVNFEPLAEKGVKLGLPGCTGGWDSMPWLRQFLANCSDIVSEGRDNRKNCTWDFLPVHWYDNFEGLASHVGERRAEWPGVEIWVTEYALAHNDLSATQSHFNTTLEWFDEEDFIGGYTYFGAFRSEDSNVGPEATFLNNGGELTDLGGWYLGFGATGVDPQSGEAGRVVVGMGMLAMAVMVGMMV